MPRRRCRHRRPLPPIPTLILGLPVLLDLAAPAAGCTAHVIAAGAGISLAMRSPSAFLIAG